MKAFPVILFLLFPILGHFLTRAEETYFPETDPVVLKKITDWQDLKFGLMIHWGPYSQWGVVESWSICAEDEDWCRRNDDDYIRYKKNYENLKSTFKPTSFDPEKWAAAARDAGMRYLVFTTKHHDGFCMFDTGLTDYRVTDPGCPFHSDPRANITRELFRAFRDQGFWIGAYFSKPDWHCPDYWWPNFATPDRNVNYEIERYPERWKRFVQYTHGQIDEILAFYGPIDILWFDGGWVQPLAPEKLREMKLDPQFRFQRLQSQDIDMASLAEKARRRQPGLILVDRAVPGPFQNYLTPEARIPEGPLPFPWETCMPLATSWSYKPGDRYKPASELIHMLVEITAKGGNFLLNVGPDAEGKLAEDAYARLREMGAWLKVNGDAIYAARTLTPFSEGDLRFTRNEKGERFAMILDREGKGIIPHSVVLPFHVKTGTRMEMLGTSISLKQRPHANGTEVLIPESIRRKPPCNHAWTVRIGL